MMTVLTRLRSRLHIWRRVLLRYRLTAVSVALACLGAATAVGSPPIAVSVAAAVAGTAVSVLEIRSHRRGSRRVRFQRRKGDDYGDLLAGLPADGRVIRTPGDVGILMTDESARLLRAPVPVVFDGAPFRVHPGMERYSLSFLAHRARRSVMFNGRVLGLRSDLRGDDPVRLGPVGYFDFVATNLLAPYDVNEVGRAEPVLRGRDLVFDSHGRLRDFRYSRLANTVGVSTLALTTDGKLLLNCQTVDSTGSPGLVAPSGSGALEPGDAGHAARSLQDLVLAGAHRELREECNLDGDAVEDGEVIGYGRWISRGGMPEFCAVTLLSRTADEIVGGRIRRRERPYIGDVLAVRPAAVRDWSSVRPLELLPEVAHRHAASWPLVFALTCLTRTMRDPAWRLRDKVAERLAGVSR